MSFTVNVLYAPGTNSHNETMYAFNRAGASASLLMLHDVLSGDAQLDSADALCIPGGFTYGDHLGAGALVGQLLQRKLSDQLARARTKPILAICNGFQIAVRAGLFGDGVALLPNAGGTFRNIVDQPHVISNDTNSVWLRGLGGEMLRFSCAHGEGRFFASSQDHWHAAILYPADENPDGSQDNIGGISTDDGLVLGLMDHPERQLNDRNLEIFRNVVRV